MRKTKRKIKAAKSIRYYLKIYFVCLFLSLFIFGIGNFFKNDFKCSNTDTCNDFSVRVDNDEDAYFFGQKVTPPKVDLSYELASIQLHENQVLGDSVPKEDKRIYIDLSTQTMHAYEGDREIMQTLISSGKWGTKTPVGNFNVWIKLPVTRMAGGSGNTAYNLPNVKWVMYFYNDYGTHTAYWHNNFGNPMSHGCINMREIDAKEVYLWADGPENGEKGTAVSVCNEFKGAGKCRQINPINPIKGGV